MRKGRAVKRIFLWFGVGLLIAIGYCAWRFGPLVMAFYRQGFFDNPAMREYEGTSSQNLKALHTALLLYHESEGQFPSAAGWMDAIRNRVKVADMSEEEAMKKFRNPRFEANHAAGVYGYSMNDAASGAYRDDLKEGGKTILLYEEGSAKWNAHGSPTRSAGKDVIPGGNLAITVDGNVVRIK